MRIFYCFGINFKIKFKKKNKFLLFSTKVQNILAKTKHKIKETVIKTQKREICEIKK